MFGISLHFDARNYAYKMSHYDHPYKIQEAQLMLTNPRDACRGQLRSPNIPINEL